MKTASDYNQSISSHDDGEVFTFVFETEAERDAFRAGVEYVNDSAVEVVGSDEHDQLGRSVVPGRYRLHVLDREAG